LKYISVDRRYYLKANPRIKNTKALSGLAFLGDREPDNPVDLDYYWFNISYNLNFTHSKKEIIHPYLFHKGRQPSGNINIMKDIYYICA
jgi:hypothetical protein